MFMHIELSEAIFPDKSIETVKEHRDHNFSSILLIPGTGFREILTETNLKAFTDCVKANFPGQELITLYNYPSFSRDQIKLMLSNRDFVNQLMPFEFIRMIDCNPNIRDFIIANPYVNERLLRDKKLDIETYYSWKGIINSQVLSIELIQQMLSNRDFVQFLTMVELERMVCISEEIADFALTNQYVIERLNSQDNNEQIFSKSCAARCIMRVLLDTGLLTRDDYTGRKEFEIYKQIWAAPGSIARPDRVISYLQSCMLEVSGVDLEKQSLSQLSRNPGLADEYRFFKSILGNRLVIINQDSMNEPVLGIGVCALLIHEGPHIVFAKRDEDGHFEIMDPSTGNTKQFDSFKQYVEQTKEFLGIGLTAEQRRLA